MSTLARANATALQCTSFHRSPRGSLREPPDLKYTVPIVLGSRSAHRQLRFQSWSLTSLQQRLFKPGGRLIRHARYFILRLAESHLTQRLFGKILGRIERLAAHPT
jgi:hypothetical protein